MRYRVVITKDRAMEKMLAKAEGSFPQCETAMIDVGADVNVAWNSQDKALSLKGTEVDMLVRAVESFTVSR